MSVQQNSLQQCQKVTGSLLVASPYASGTPYQRKVVLVIEHGEQGSVGILLTEKVQELFREIGVQLKHFLSGEDDRMVLPKEISVPVVGWGAGGLDQELRSGTWLTVPATLERMLGDSSQLWVNLVRDAGRSVLRDSLRITNFPPNPFNN